MTHKQGVFTLKKAYGAARTSPNSRTLPLDFLLGPNTVHSQNELVDELLQGPHFRDFPPSCEFRRLFWKCIVEYLEAGCEEVDGRIYEAYLDLLSTRSSSFAIRPPSPSYITHFWSSCSDDTTKPDCMRLTTLLESRTMIEGGTTGLRTWEASLEFANWLVRHPDIVQARKVLELGSGAGFLGLIIAALQTDRPDANIFSHTSLVLSDVNSEVLSRCRQNFLLPCNRMCSHPSMEFRLLDWSAALDSDGNIDLKSSINATLVNIDTIIGADLVYDASVVPALVAVLALFFRAERAESSSGSEYHGRCAYIAMTVRREQTVSAFLSSLRFRHLKYEEIDMGMTDVSQKQFLDGVKDTADCKVKLIKITSAF